MSREHKSFTATDLTCLSSWASVWLTDGWRTCTCNWDNSPARTSSGSSDSWHLCCKPEPMGGRSEKVQSARCLRWNQTVNSKYGKWGNKGKVTHRDTQITVSRIMRMKCFYTWIHALVQTHKGWKIDFYCPLVVTYIDDMEKRKQDKHFPTLS